MAEEDVRVNGVCTVHLRHTHPFLVTPNLKKARTLPGMKMLLFVEDLGSSYRIRSSSRKGSFHVT